MKRKIIITNYKGRLSNEEAERVVQDAKRFKDEDATQLMKVKAKLDLENYAYKMKNDINSKILGAMLPFTIQKKFKDDVERVIQWSIDDR